MVKVKVGDLKDEVRELFYRRLRKYLAVVVQGVYGKRRLLGRFQYGSEKDMTSNQLTSVTVESIPMTKEYKVSTISVMPDKKFYF